VVHPFLGRSKSCAAAKGSPALVSQITKSADQGQGTLGMRPLET
jgi:hypothetical protein